MCDVVYFLQVDLIERVVLAGALGPRALDEVRSVYDESLVEPLARMSSLSWEQRELREALGVA